MFHDPLRGPPSPRSVCAALPVPVAPLLNDGAFVRTAFASRGALDRALGHGSPPGSFDRASFESALEVDANERRRFSSREELYAVAAGF